jgi:hypothetical protein
MEREWKEGTKEAATLDARDHLNRRKRTYVIQDENSHSCHTVNNLADT